MQLKSQHFKVIAMSASARLSINSAKKQSRRMLS